MLAARTDMFSDAEWRTANGGQQTTNGKRRTCRPLHSRNQDLRHQFGFRSDPWVVNVVFDAEVIAHLNFLFSDHLKYAAGSFRQIGVRPSQNETAVLAALEF